MGTLSIQLLQIKGYILNFIFCFYSRVSSQAALENHAFKIKAKTKKNLQIRHCFTNDCHNNLNPKCPAELKSLYIDCVRSISFKINNHKPHRPRANLSMKMNIGFSLPEYENQQLIHPATEYKLCFTFWTSKFLSPAANQQIFAEVPFLFPVVAEHLLLDT